MLFASADLARREDLASKGYIDKDTVKAYGLGKIVLAWSERNNYVIMALQT